jgi:prolyl-tRNA editing enzyme YbaK/EbsC (Cys-tRNA(Pro) deacylase)
MAIERVREHFIQYGREEEIVEFEVSSATVDLAAKAIGTEGARIAKTLSFRNGDEAMLVVTAGDARMDNKKFKKQFGFKARMLKPEEVLEQTGHAIGGVCPFGLIKELPVYLDVSMKRFETLYPACGSSNSAIKLTCDEIAEYSNSVEWVDVCKDWESEQ